MHDHRYTSWQFFFYNYPYCVTTITLLDFRQFITLANGADFLSKRQPYVTARTYEILTRWLRLEH
jgi:hypothetical protein